MSGHYAEAVEAVARMLPLVVPPDGEYEVARAALNAAAPHLAEHFTVERHLRLIADLRSLHRPGSADPDGLRVCVECRHVWPCPTARLL